MPRTGVEQSQILPGNQAILEKALQKALQSTRCWLNYWRDGTICRRSSSRQFLRSRDSIRRMGKPNIDLNPSHFLNHENTLFKKIADSR